MAAAAWSFYALGNPAPQGSKSFRGTRNGKGVMVESSARLRPWRETVKAAAPAIPEPLDGPLAVIMVFTVPRPRSEPKRSTIPYRTPDLSKLARAVEDACTDAGLWVDDARVASYERLEKVWPDTGGLALPVPGVVVACGPYPARKSLGLLGWVAARDACVRVRGAP